MANSGPDSWAEKPKFITAFIDARFQFFLALITFIAIVVYGVSVYLYRPYDGLSVSVLYGPEVLAVQPNSPAEKAGIREEDVILAIDGQPVDPFLQRPLYRLGIHPGQVVTYRIQRDGSVFDTSAAIGSYRDNLGWIAPVSLVLALAVVFWLVGLLLCLFADLGNIQARLLGAGWLIAGVASAAGGPGVFAHFWTAGTALKISWIILAFLLIASHLYFPAVSFTGRKRKWILSVWAVLAIGLSILVSIEDIYLKPRGYSLIQNGIQVSILDYTYFFLSILVSFFLLLRNRFQERDPDVRRQTGIILWGMLLGFGPFLGLSLFPKLLFGPRVYYIDGAYTIFFLVLMPLAYGYVIFQHRLIKVDFLINRIVVLFVLALCVLIVSFTLLGITVILFHLPDSLPVFGSLVTLLVFLPSAAFQEKIQEQVNRTLYGGYYDPATVTSYTSGQLVQISDRSALTHLLTDSLPHQMGIRQAALYLTQDDHLQLQSESDEACFLPIADRICQLLTENRIPLRKQSLMGDPRILTSESWEKLDWAQLFVPIASDEDLRGVLLLGSRFSGDLYSDRDIRIVATVAHQAALALANVQLVETLHGLTQQLVRTEEHRRAQLARDLHDSILQDLFLIKQRLNTHRYEHEVADHLGMVIDRLRDTIDEQHPKLLKSGLSLAIRGLVDDMQNLSGEKGPRIEFQSSLDDLYCPPEEISISIYRIVQEALANALKHSDARRIRVCLEHLPPSSLHVIVEDHGKGLPPSWDSGLGQEKHFGLANMKERAAMIHAKLRIDSEEGQGTQVSLEVRG